MNEARKQVEADNATIIYGPMTNNHSKVKVAVIRWDAAEGFAYGVEITEGEYPETRTFIPTKGFDQACAIFEAVRQ